MLTRRNVHVCYCSRGVSVPGRALLLAARRRGWMDHGTRLFCYDKPLLGKRPERPRAELPRKLLHLSLEAKGLSKLDLQEPEAGANQQRRLREALAVSLIILGPEGDQTVGLTFLTLAISSWGARVCVPSIVSSNN